MNARYIYLEWDRIPNASFDDNKRNSKVLLSHFWSQSTQLLRRQWYILELELS
jgi:hypothetical protein